MKEIFKRYQSLTLFDCTGAPPETDGCISLVCEDGMRRHLNLRDTAVNPKGWNGCKMEIAYNSFKEDTVLIMCFGKPFSNEPSETAKAYIKISKTVLAEGDNIFPYNMCENGNIEILVQGNILCINGISVSLKEPVEGYTEIFCEKGNLNITEVTIDCPNAPYTEEKHNTELIKWRHSQLDKRDKYLDALEEYIKQNPDAVPTAFGEIQVPKGIVEKGEKMTVKVVCETENASLTITHDCFNQSSVPEAIPLEFIKDKGKAYAHIDICFNKAGNTRIELWTREQKYIRQVAVLDEGYMAVIPWIGSNRPYVDEELHKFDIPGDYWISGPAAGSNPEAVAERFSRYIKNHHKYGDRLVCFVNARALISGSETDTLYELDYESRKRGFAQLKRQMSILGYDDMELVASYTPDASTIEILEELGVKGLTSLCAWQNWQDHGWKINHCGVPNQPYYPANDDFRRAGEKRSLMCFTMGNASCNRNYSVMVFDACPTSIVPGERYLKNYVVNQQIQRFYDVFDGYIADSKNNKGSLMTVTVPIESFAARMDWNAANEMALRYMAKKAAEEKIVFTSAAEIADYHKRKALDMQPAYFFQPDYYYGYHNGTMPGRIGDRLEADTKEYLAVIRRGSMLPMYFYDYTKEWDGSLIETTERNEFGQIDPDEHKPSECFPKQVYTEDMEISYNISGNLLKIFINSKTPKERIVSGIFDIPFENDFEITFDKSDVSAVKISDLWTGNTHIFLDLGGLKAGETVVTGKLCGKQKTPVAAEDIKDGFAVMWFGSHAYMRSCDKEAAISVEMAAPNGANLRLISGKKLFAEKGKLVFNVNTDWFDEAPILYNFPREEFQKALKTAKVKVIGKTKCSRWSGQ